jgi:hypothetical protein
LSRLVVLVLLSSLRGRCVGCIWGGVGVGWRACVELWRRADRSWCVDFVRLPDVYMFRRCLRYSVWLCFVCRMPYVCLYVYFFTCGVATMYIDLV